MNVVWEKEYTINAQIQTFTIGNDWQLDTELVYADVLGSMAHVKSLQHVHLLTTKEAQTLHHRLKEVLSMSVALTPDDEDCHSWLEQYLIRSCGDLGKKVHTGRSRNDQVLVTTRLYTREMLTILLHETGECISLLAKRGKREEEILFPGRTHMQPAMPFSLGLVWQSYAEQLLDDLQQVEMAYALNDRSPLGSAAGYGVPLPLDRQYVSDLLGFREVQNNVLAVQNSRGRIEAAVLNAVEQLAITFSRLASEMMTYSLCEFGYFSLPKEYCTGSSIMPHKKNPDVLELIRARSHTISSWAQLVRSLPVALPSGYHRDFQESKEPLLRALQSIHEIVSVMQIIIPSLQVHADRLNEAVKGELLATDAVFQKVREGVSFRDAYHQVARDIDHTSFDLPDIRSSRSSIGTPGNPRWEYITEKIDALQQDIHHKRKIQKEVQTSLTGNSFPLCQLTYHPFFP